MNPSWIWGLRAEGRVPDKSYSQNFQSDDFNIIGSHWAKYSETFHILAQF